MTSVMGWNDLGSLMLQNLAELGKRLKLCQPIQQCRRHLGISKYAGPLREAQFSGDNHVGVLVQLEPLHISINLRWDAHASEPDRSKPSAHGHQLFFCQATLFPNIPAGQDSAAPGANGDWLETWVHMIGH